MKQNLIPNGSGAFYQRRWRKISNFPTSHQENSKEVRRDDGEEILSVDHDAEMTNKARQRLQRYIDY